MHHGILESFDTGQMYFSWAYMSREDHEAASDADALMIFISASNGNIVQVPDQFRGSIFLNRFPPQYQSTSEWECGYIYPICNMNGSYTLVTHWLEADLRRKIF